MTDYTAWLIEEREEEERETALTPPLSPLLRTGRPVERERAPEETAVPAAAAAVSPSAGDRGQRTAPRSPEEERAAALAALGERNQTPRSALDPGREESAGRRAATAELYRELSESRRQAQAAASPMAASHRLLPDPAEGPSSPALDLAAIDRSFEQDARRYDPNPLW